MISMCYFTKVYLLFPCGSKSFLNFWLSSTRLLIKCFLIKECVPLSFSKLGIRKLHQLRCMYVEAEITKIIILDIIILSKKIS